MKISRAGLRYALDVLTTNTMRSTSLARHCSTAVTRSTAPATLFPHLGGKSVSGTLVTRHLSRTSGGDEEDNDFFKAQEEEEEEYDPVGYRKKEEERQEEKLERCESWVHDIAGKKQQLVALNPHLFGLPPRTDILTPIVLRQLKYKLQDQPYGCEINNFVGFDRLSDPMYGDRPYLSPWVAQGLAWNTLSYTLPTRIKADSTRHLPVPHYNGNVPRKLRELGVRVLLSLKYRYNKLHIVDSLSTPDRYMEPQHLRAILDELEIRSALMITGARIAPYYKSEFWKREEKFPVEQPGSQRFWKTASYTRGCELRELAGLDVWSGLLYDTLVLDLPAIQELEATLDCSTFHTANVSLRNSLQRVSSEQSLGVSRPRHKVVRVLNIDNL